MASENPLLTIERMLNGRTTLKTQKVTHNNIVCKYKNLFSLFSIQKYGASLKISWCVYMFWSSISTEVFVDEKPPTKT